MIVFATGYGVRFPFLSPTLACGGAAARAAGSQRAERGAEHALPSEHLVVEPHAPRLARIGFVRPNVGAIPPMAEMQVLWWIERLRGRTRHQRAPPSYGLLGRKLAYGVDYGNYMHQLAAEIGAAPTLADLCRSPRALIAYALGQAYIPFFRLVGPFASDAAWRVAASELYAPVLQRGVIMNAARERPRSRRDRAEIGSRAAVRSPPLLRVPPSAPAIPRTAGLCADDRRVWRALAHCARGRVHAARHPAARRHGRGRARDRARGRRRGACG